MFTFSNAQMIRSTVAGQRILTPGLQPITAAKARSIQRSRLPVKLVYHEVYEDLHDALSREWHLKRLSREEKLELIEASPWHRE